MYVTYVFLITLYKHLQTSKTYNNCKKESEPYRKFWPQDRISTNGDSSQQYYHPKSGVKLRKEHKPSTTESKTKRFSNGTDANRITKKPKDKNGSVASLASSEESMNEYDVETATTTSIHSPRSASRSSASRSSSFKGPRVITITANCSVLDEPCESPDHAKETTHFSNIETQVDFTWHAVVDL